MWKVRFARKAETDLLALYEFLANKDLQAANRARAALRGAFGHVARLPFAGRRASKKNAAVRELVVPFGSAGYVILYEINDPKNLTVLGVRHQREKDYR